MASNTVELSKLQLAEIIEAQVVKAAAEFEKLYNSKGNGHIRYRINSMMDAKVEDTKPTRTLLIELVRDGEGIMVYKKAYRFQHPLQTKDEGEWKLTLWMDAFQGLISGGLLYSLVLADARKERALIR